MRLLKNNNINSYLNKLRKIISKELPKDECKNIMEYYEEYVADAGFETEADIINELGTPEALAKKIVEEHNEKFQSDNIEGTEKKGLSLGWVTFIAIIGSPLWLALLCVAFSLVVTVFALVITFGATGIGLALGGIGLIIGGVVLLFIDVVLGIYVVGCACIVCAVGILFIWLTILLVKCTIKVFNSLKTKKNKKKSEVIFD